LHGRHPIFSLFIAAARSGKGRAAARYIEQAFDDKMVIVFTQGASGDQNPLLMRPATNALASKSGVKITGYELVREEVEALLREGQVPHGKFDPKVVDRLERWIEREGQLLGEEVIRVMTNSRNGSSDVAISGAQKAISCPDRQSTDSGREGEPGTYKDSESISIRLSMLGIGDIALTAVNAEMYTMIAQRAKRHSPIARRVVVTLANGRVNSGYIRDDSSYGHNTFQVLGTRLKPGCAEQGIANGLDNLVAST
jgi:neutral ceramidase